MKRDGGQNVAFSYVKALSVSLGFQKCFISKAQNGCVKFAVQALLNWQWKKSILLKMSGSGGWNNHNLYFACYVISYLNKKSIDVDLIGPSVIEGLFHALCLSHFLLIPEDFEVWY